MNLSIIHLPKMDRAWLLKRENGKYSQHAHFYSRKEAEMCRRLIDRNQYPRQKKYIYPMQRILTEEEFKHLRKKPRYFNVQKGGKNWK